MDCRAHLMLVCSARATWTRTFDWADSNLYLHVSSKLQIDRRAQFESSMMTAATSATFVLRCLAGQRVTVRECDERRNGATSGCGGRGRMPYVVSVQREVCSWTLEACFRCNIL